MRVATLTCVCLLSGCVVTDYQSIRCDVEGKVTATQAQKCSGLGWGGGKDNICVASNAPYCQDTTVEFDSGDNGQRKMRVIVAPGECYEWQAAPSTQMIACNFVRLKNAPPSPP